MDCDYTFSFHRRQRERFREGALVREWCARYPQLFDKDDQRGLATRHQRKYHFLEWLAAILLFESSGYVSLVEKYTASDHPEKRDKLRSVLTPTLAAWLQINESGQPDLFVYSPSDGEWFFCEVKGPGDSIRENQHEWRKRFEQVLHGEGYTVDTRYRVLCLREVGA